MEARRRRLELVTALLCFGGLSLSGQGAKDVGGSWKSLSP